MTPKFAWVARLLAAPQGVTRAVRHCTAVVVLATAALMPASAHAQGSAGGTLAGTVSDASGAVLPGVTVTAKATQTGLAQQTVSGGEGDWRIPSLPSAIAAGAPADPLDPSTRVC